MLRLASRTWEQGIAHHQRNPLRVYAEDPIQKERIDKSRQMVENSLTTFHSSERLLIVELGCGTGDICGAFSERHIAYGIECAPRQAEKAHERFPKLVVFYGAIENIDPFECDILILCETLEHLENPKEITKAWLAHARRCVISHPIDEQVDAQYSAGDHAWSFNRDDFKNWFELGGHNISESMEFAMGNYTIALGRGIRRTEVT